MSEERFWNTDEYVSTAKFAVQDGAMTMRQAVRIFHLNPAPPKVEDINDYIHTRLCKQNRVPTGMLSPLLETQSQGVRVSGGDLKMHRILQHRPNR